MLRFCIFPCVAFIPLASHRRLTFTSLTHPLFLHRRRLGGIRAAALPPFPHQDSDLPPGTSHYFILIPLQGVLLPGRGNYSRIIGPSRRGDDWRRQTLPSVTICAHQLFFLFYGTYSSDRNKLFSSTRCTNMQRVCSTSAPLRSAPPGSPEPD